MKKMKKRLSFHGELIQKWLNWWREKLPSRKPDSSIEEVAGQVVDVGRERMNLGFSSSTFQLHTFQPEVNLDMRQTGMSCLHI